MVQTYRLTPLPLPHTFMHGCQPCTTGRADVAAGRRSTGRSAWADQPSSDATAAEPPQAAVSAAGTMATELQDRIASNAAAGPSGREGTVFATNDFSFVVPADFVDKQPPPPPTAGFGAPVRSTLSAPQQLIRLAGGAVCRVETAC